MLRYDDYSAHSPTELERQMIDLLRKRRLSCAFGIIPFACEDQLDPFASDRHPLPPAKAEVLKDALRDATVEPLLHGHSHRTLPPSSVRRRPSELDGAELDHQLRLLGEGKSFLEEALGSPVRFFAPPWNSYDRQTLRVLDRLGFRGLSAGPRFGDSDPRSRLELLPATCRLTELWEAVAQARRLADPSPTVVALFHPYDFVEADRVRGKMSLSDFASTLDWILSQEDLRPTAFEAESDAGHELGERRYARNRSLKRMRTWTPPPLAGLGVEAPGVYLSNRGARGACLRKRLLLIGFYLGVALLLASVSFLIAKDVAPFVPWLVAGISALVLGYLALRPKQTYKSLTLGAAVAGFLLGFLAAASRFSSLG